MTGQADRCRAVLAISARIGQRVEVDAAHDAVLRCAETDVHLHLMARRGCGLALDTAENDLGGLFRHPRDERRIDCADRGLLRAEAAADARLGDADHALRDVQRVGDDAARMEHDLGRAEHVQTAVGVDAAIGSEGLHHGLLAGAGMVNAVDHDVARAEHLVDVAAAALVVRAQIALIIRAHRRKALPVVLGVYEDGVVLGFGEVEKRLEHLVFDLDQPHRLVHALFVLACDNRNDVADKADMAVDDQTVIRTRLGISLACLRVAAAVLRHVLPGEDALHAGYLHGGGGIDALDDGVRMGRAQQLDAQAALRDHVIHVHRLTGDELHRVLFAQRFVYDLHALPSSFCFFHARNARMPRS